MPKSKTHAKRKLKKQKEQQKFLAWAQRRGPEWLVERRAELDELEQKKLEKTALLASHAQGEDNVDAQD